MDNQRDKQEQYPRAELSAANNVLARDKRIEEIRANRFDDDVEFLLAELKKQVKRNDLHRKKNISLQSEVSQLRAKITALEAERDELKFDCTMQREELKAFNEALYEYAASGSDTKLREVYQNYCVRDRA